MKDLELSITECLNDKEAALQVQSLDEKVNFVYDKITQLEQGDLRKIAMLKEALSSAPANTNLSPLEQTIANTKVEPSIVQNGKSKVVSHRRQGSASKTPRGAQRDRSKSPMI